MLSSAAVPDVHTPASPFATLAYERPDEQQRAQETAAVWRVVWWIGVLWSIGTILGTFPTLWTLLTGGWAESRLAELPFGAASAALRVLQGATAAALAGALLANARRRVIAILATLASLLLLLGVINGLLLGGVYFERSFHLVWLSTIVVRMLLWGGIVLVALVAWLPGWMTPTRLFVAVAVLLLGVPVAQVVDLLYWWLVRGESMGQVVRDRFSWQSWPDTLGASLVLPVAVLFIVTPGAMRTRRWLLAIAVVVATAGLNSYILWYLSNLSFYWNSGGLSWLCTTIADGLRDAAPVLGLLAWRLRLDPRAAGLDNVRRLEPSR